MYVQCDTCVHVCVWITGRVLEHENGQPAADRSRVVVFYKTTVLKKVVGEAICSQRRTRAGHLSCRWVHRFDSVSSKCDMYEIGSTGKLKQYCFFVPGKRKSGFIPCEVVARGEA